MAQSNTNAGKPSEYVPYRTLAMKMTRDLTGSFGALFTGFKKVGGTLLSAAKIIGQFSSSNTGEVSNQSEVIKRKRELIEQLSTKFPKVFEWKEEDSEETIIQKKIIDYFNIIAEKYGIINNAEGKEAKTNTKKLLYESAINFCNEQIEHFLAPDSVNGVESVVRLKEFDGNAKKLLELYNVTKYDYIRGSYEKIKEIAEEINSRKDINNDRKRILIKSFYMQIFINDLCRYTVLLDELNNPREEQTSNQPPVSKTYKETTEFAIGLISRMADRDGFVIPDSLFNGTSGDTTHNAQTGKKSNDLNPDIGLDPCYT